MEPGTETSDSPGQGLVELIDVLLDELALLIVLVSATMIYNKERQHITGQRFQQYKSRYGGYGDPLLREARRG